MRSCVVLFSGGIDSTTALCWALDRYDRVFPLTFDYGQRHRVEVRMAKRAARELGLEPVVLKLDLGQVGGSALTDPAIPVPRPRGLGKLKAGTPADLRSLPERHPAGGRRGLGRSARRHRPHLRLQRPGFAELPGHAARVHPGHGKGRQRGDPGRLRRAGDADPGAVRRHAEIGDHPEGARPRAPIIRIRSPATRAARRPAAPARRACSGRGRGRKRAARIRSSRG